MFRSMAIAMAMLGLCFAGCEKESEMGGPGATDTNNSTDNGDNQREDNTFTLSVDEGLNIVQGENLETAVHINRGDVFMQSVTLDFEAPAGVTVTPASDSLTSDKDELTVLIQVDENADTGETNIKVTGTPETGKAVSVQIPLTIEMKDNGNG